MRLLWQWQQPAEASSPVSKIYNAAFHRGFSSCHQQRTLATATAEAVADAVPVPEPWVFTLAEV